MKRRQRRPISHRHLIGLLFCMVTLVMTGAYHFPSQPAAAAVLAYQTPVFSIPQSSYLGAEGSTIQVVVQISAAPPASSPATVQYATTPGTALPGTDYTAVSGVITFTNTSPLQVFIPIQTFVNNSSFSNRSFTFSIANAVNATIDPTRTSTQVIIQNTNATATATGTGAPPIFADALEPNNSFNEASQIDAGAAARCNLTFYPPGDEDYFRWWAQAGISYRVSTSNLEAGIDTLLRVYNTNQNQIGENDDQSPGSRNSSFEFTASVTGYYYARVVNTIPGDPVDKTYCFEVSRFVQATLTPPPGLPSGADECEYNSTLEFACLIVAGQTLSLTFVPTFGSHQDTDMFRLWVKPGIFYTCETVIPSGSAADTNVILLDRNGNPFNPWIGNDDKEQGDFGSKVEYLATYTGWLYIEVGPVNVPPLEEAPLHTYTLTCTQLVATPTPTATNTSTPAPAPPGGSFSTPTPIPTIAFPTPLPTPTPINPADFIPTPVPPPLIDVQPLPTATPLAGGGQTVNIRVTIFYDSNGDYQPELTEGIMGLDVALFDNATGELLSYGQTNQAGMIHFESIQATGTVRILVPYLNYSQIITQSTDDVLIRVAPGTLPIGIP